MQGMPRQNQLLYPPREPVTPLHAATVLLLRDSPQGPQVLMTRRSLNASFAPGAYVFPGGGIEPSDAQAHAQAQRRPGQHDTHLTQAIAAIRESFEELGILLARHADGSPVTANEVARLNRQSPLLPQCQQHGWRLAADEVYLLARWITDRDLPRRFDVPFLVARMPSDQTPVADQQEQFDPVWVRPAEALARHQAPSAFAKAFSFVPWASVSPTKRVPGIPAMPRSAAFAARPAGPKRLSCWKRALR